MTRDHLNDSGGDWEPDDSPAPAEHGRQKSPRGTSRGGIILMASTALAVILASGLGVGSDDPAQPTLTQLDHAIWKVARGR